MAPAIRPPMLFLLALIVAAPGCSKAASRGTLTAAQVRVGDKVLLQKPIRFGVNLGQSTYYGDQQIVDNPFIQGGFSKGRQVYMMQVGQATQNTVTDSYAAALTQSLEGGTYHIATGARAGEKGTVVGHELGPPSTFTLEHSGSPVEQSDVVWFRGKRAARALPDRQGVERGIGIGDFRLIIEEGVSFDYAPNGPNEMDQAIAFHFLPKKGRSVAGVKHYIRATANTRYTLRCRAKGTVPGAKLGAALKNHGIPHTDQGASVKLFSREEPLLTGEWRDYVFTGGTYTDERIADNFSAVSLVVDAEPVPSAGTVWIDDVVLEDSRSESETAFRKQVLSTLKEARCGVLRFYGITSLQALIESITCKNSTESSWSYLSLSDGYRFGHIDAVVDEWMGLCIAVDAQPWLTIGGGNTPDDWYRLISYLAAPANFDADAQRRKDHGYAKPWSEQFDTIYLEIGNEWWNAIFRPFHVWPPETYGEICAHIIEAIRAHPHFDEDVFEIVAGGWAVNAHHWNDIVDATAQGHDVVSIAPYLLHELDVYETYEARYGALFADVDAYPKWGGKRTQDGLAKNAKGTRLAAYELNTHITGGKAPANIASEMCPSLAAGVAVLDHAMSLMAHLQVNPINYFTLLQRGYGRGVGNARLGLWGNLVRTPSGRLRPRPVWQGLRMANKYLIDGPMVEVDVTNSPAWNQPENGNVPKDKAVPYIHAYAFQPPTAPGEARRLNLLLINRHRVESLMANLALPFEPAPQATKIVLTGPDPGTNNEEAELIQLKETQVDDFSPSESIAIPPFSAIAYQIREK